MKAPPAFKKKSCGLALAAFALLLPRPVDAFGPTGHSLVGAIAQAKLSQTPSGQAALKKALALLADPSDKDHAGLSLLVAGPIPDDLRTWDNLVTKALPADQVFKKWPKVESVPPVWDSFYHKEETVGSDWPDAVRQQLWAYFANNCGPDDYDPGQPRHHVFHFCDIAIADGADLTYGKKTGTGPHDIVHMIDYCADVLAGKKPAGTPPPPVPAPYVTKTVALVLLVHLLGDLHQPLHVGSQYFDATGKPADPAKDPKALGDRGGNLVKFEDKNLHGQWDSAFVSLAVKKWQKALHLSPAKPADPDADLTALAAALVKGPGLPALQFPAGATTATLVPQWAGEGVQLSQKAHDQLTFSQFQAGSSGTVIGGISATAKSKPADYDAWAADAVQQQLVTAGLRLAWVIEQALH